MQRLVGEQLSQLLLLTQITGGILNKALLARLRRLRTKTGIAVENRQHGLTDADAASCGNQLLQHLILRIRRAVGVVMQIMEFSDLV